MSNYTTHGMSRTPEYRVWASMKSRCNNKNDNNYPKYGGRGIAVCKRWSDFNNFIGDMGRRPSSVHSIDRINNDGNYEPGNVRWATKRQQSLNQRKRIDNTSGYIGVSINGSKWGAWLNIDGKTYYIGSFDTPEQAAYMRDQYVIEVYAEDASLNFIYQ